jgi:hypothetical protein
MFLENFNTVWIGKKLLLDLANGGISNFFHCMGENRVLVCSEFKKELLKCRKLKNKTINSTMKERNWLERDQKIFWMKLKIEIFLNGRNTAIDTMRAG